MPGVFKLVQDTDEGLHRFDDAIDIVSKKIKEILGSTALVDRLDLLDDGLAKVQNYDGCFVLEYNGDWYLLDHYRGRMDPEDYVQEYPQEDIVDLTGQDWEEVLEKVI